MISKRQRWEHGQSIHHKDDRGRFQIENTYGRLQYIKEDSIQSKEKDGFLLEAKDAPGTPGHTEKEKHIDWKTLKDADVKEERFLYSSEKPFQNQAVFYDVTEWKRSREFMDSMKCMLSECEHRTLRDTFGFLEQEPDRLRKQILEQERLKQLTLEEFDSINKQIDTLNDRTQKKEAKERQLRAELQLMIDRGKEEQKNFKISLEMGREFIQENTVKTEEGGLEDEDLNEEENRKIQNKNRKNRSENQKFRTPGTGL